MARSGRLVLPVWTQPTLFLDPRSQRPFPLLYSTLLSYFFLSSSSHHSPPFPPHLPPSSCSFQYPTPLRSSLLFPPYPCKVQPLNKTSQYHLLIHIYIHTIYTYVKDQLTIYNIYNTGGGKEETDIIIVIDSGLSMEDKEEASRSSSSNGGNNNKKQRKWKRQPQQEQGRFQCSFQINDHPDVLVEVLARLDARSLAAAACVSRLWSSLCRHDALWESLCPRHHPHHHHPPSSSSSSSNIRPIVAALGGYRRLYASCVRPALARLRERDRRRLTLSLSLSLFSVHCYERLGNRGEAPSLWFLCHPLNVS